MQYPVVKPDIIGFVKPFPFLVWTSIIGVLLMAITIFWILAVARESAGRFFFRDGREMFMESFFTCLGMLLAQGVNLSRMAEKGGKGKYIRWLAVVWLLFSLIISSVYKSNLNAMLTAPQVRVPFNSFEELLEQNEMPYGVLQNSYSLGVFEKSEPGSLFGRFYETMLPPFGDVMKGMKEVSEGKVAIGGLSSGIEGFFERDFSQNGCCQMTRMRGKFLEVKVAMAFHKNSVLKKPLDDVIIRLKEAGIISHWLNSKMANASNCLLTSRRPEQTLRALSLKDFYGAFSLLITGFFVASIVLAFEGFGQKCDKHITDRSQPAINPQSHVI